MSTNDTQFRTSSTMEKDPPAPDIGQTEWGDFNRLRPFSSTWGSERGRPVDRHYIEAFLGQHVSDFAGRALEIENDNYLRKYGRHSIQRFEILDINSDNPRATMIAVLAIGKVPSGRRM